MNLEQAVDVVNKYLDCDFHVRNNLNFCLKRQSKSTNGDCSCCPYDFSDIELNKALNTFIDEYSKGKSAFTIDRETAIPVEDAAGMLAYAHNGKLPCDLEWYECKKRICTNGDKSCWLQVLVEGELDE